MTSPPASSEDLFDLLTGLALPYRTVDHPAFFTVEDGRELKATLPGGHTKNLFLKDKKGALWLLTALADRHIDLNAAAKALGAGRFSFASAETLYAVLGVTPGSVTAFALINDAAKRVRFALDAGLLDYEVIYCHPLRNDATTAIAPADLLRFLDHLGRSPALLAFDEAGKPQLRGDKAD